MRPSSPAKPEAPSQGHVPAAELKPLELPPLPERPLFSILVANYNYEHFLEQSLTSALTQTYPRVEIVLCDDGSSDRSLEVAQRLAAKHSNLTVVEQENQGHFAALNHAYEKATGDVIAPLDADDYFRADKAKVAIETFRRRPASGMVVHPVVRVDSEGQEHGIYPFASGLPDGWLGPAVLERGGFVPWIQTGMICLRREIAERIFPMDNALPQGPDIFLRAAASLLAPVTALSETLAYYRLHGSNQGNTAQRFTAAQAVERRRKEIVEFGGVYEALDGWLARERPGFALPPFESTRPHVERSYVIARLTGADRSTTARLHERLLELSDTMTPRMRAFYRLSPRLPRPLFKTGLDLIYGQGRVKKVLSGLSARKRGGRSGTTGSSPSAER